MATGRPDHVFVPVMPAAMMLPTAMPIEWPVLPQTCAANSAAMSLPRLWDRVVMPLMLASPPGGPRHVAHRCGAPVAAARRARLRRRPAGDHEARPHGGG